MRGKKIAVSGKGGVGKSTVAALWALQLARENATVVAIDADPDANLAHALGMPSKQRCALVSLADNNALVRERTGAEAGKTGQLFSLNPRVDDLVARFGSRHRGVDTIVLGAVRKGGGGCACPESTLLKSLVRHLVLGEDEYVILDMEAGVEHIGRATAGGVDALVIVTEEGSRSMETALRIRTLAADIGLEKKLAIVMNKVRGSAAERQQSTARLLPDIPVIGGIPYDERLIECDTSGSTLLDRDDSASLIDCFEKARNNLFSLIETGFTGVPER
ncbi:MAG: P-loop NTPase [Chitinispirillaceae bacterium]|nr:P-loop NTPase [Chitinispirillaceae bacterium]